MRRSASEPQPAAARTWPCSSSCSPAGHRLAYPPAAIIQHARRATFRDLERQIYGYGLGFTAMLSGGDAAQSAARDRASVGAARLASVAARPSSAKQVNRADDYPPALARAELRGMLAGPVAYLRARMALREQASRQRARWSHRARQAAGLRKSLTVNAMALMTATIAAQGLGLMFWAVAAHLQPPRVIGQASAGVAALTLLAVMAPLAATNVSSACCRAPTAGGRWGDAATWSSCSFRWRRRCVLRDRAERPRGARRVAAGRAVHPRGAGARRLRARGLGAHRAAAGAMGGGGEHHHRRREGRAAACACHIRDGNRRRLGAACASRRSW